MIFFTTRNLINYYNNIRKGLIYKVITNNIDICYSLYNIRELKGELVLC